MRVQNFVNLTPHTVDFQLPMGGGRMSWPSVGIARVDTSSVPQPALFTAPDENFPGGLEFHVEKTLWGAVTGLPPQMPGRICIVSLIVLQALRGSRPDVVAPRHRSERWGHPVPRWTRARRAG